MTMLYVDDRLGNVYEIPHGKVTLKRTRQNRVGSLEFQYYGGGAFSADFKIEPGMVIRFEKDDDQLFFGYVFKVNKSSILCYDQMRYLKFKDTKVFVDKTASEIIKEIAIDNNMPLGVIDDTKYVIPSQISDQVDYLDMIGEALQSTLLATGRLYFLQDNFGQLELQDIANTHIDLVIDGYNNLSSYDYAKEIDSDTYNRIKLAKDNKVTGKREIYIYEDSQTIGQWGKLQFYEVVNEKLNKAQINEKGERLIALKNREKKSFSLKNIIGDVRCKSGYSVYIFIPEEGIEGWYLINSDTHSFEGNAHTMDLELAVY